MTKLCRKPVKHDVGRRCDVPTFFFTPAHATLCGGVLCPYCNPSHMAYPNLEEAMRGYDVPMGNPNPGHGMADPGIRNQIFNPMIKNEDGHYQLDMRFITANHQIKCDAAWSSHVSDSFKDYVMGKLLLICIRML